MAAKVTTIVFDAAEPARLGQFWSDVLGWERKPIEGPDDWVAVGDKNWETPFILLFLPTKDLA